MGDPSRQGASGDSPRGERSLSVQKNKPLEARIKDTQNEIKSALRRKSKLDDKIVRLRARLLELHDRRLKENQEADLKIIQRVYEEGK